jgi:hypothetical protein
VTARVEWITAGGPPEPWRRLGLVVSDGLIPFHGTGIRIIGGAPGLTGWTLSGIDDAVADIDGLVTDVVPAPNPVFVVHPLGAVDLDHVVITTSSLERTSGAITDATGAELKRVREVGDVRQGFHRLGGLIVEVVERAGLADGAAALWGVVINVDDIDAACRQIGPDLVSEPRPAVQPGRSIATVRAAAGLGTAVALMSGSR